MRWLKWNKPQGLNRKRSHWQHSSCSNSVNGQVAWAGTNTFIHVHVLMLHKVKCWFQKKQKFPNSAVKKQDKKTLYIQLFWLCLHSNLDIAFVLVISSHIIILATKLAWHTVIRCCCLSKSSDWMVLVSQSSHSSLRHCQETVAFLLEVCKMEEQL